MTAHCRGCWQPVSTLVRRCPRCGDVDKYRIRLAVIKVALSVVVAAIVFGVVLWIR
jgi:hypothetical protein